MLLGIQLVASSFRLQDFYLLWCSLPSASSSLRASILLSHYPSRLFSWFRLFPFRSPLLGESRLISFPLATKMFQLARLAHTCLWIQQVVLGVAPFGYPRIKACSRLPVAFRSVPRPSSPPGAKASTECPSHAQAPCTGVTHTQRRDAPAA